LAQAAQSILNMVAPDRTLLARIWTRQADFSGSLSDYEEAQTLLQQSLEVWQAAPIHLEHAFTLAVWGRMSIGLAGMIRLRRICRPALPCIGQTRDQWGLAQALNYLGNVICNQQNDYDPAIPLYEESLALSRQIGDLAGIARALIIWARLRTPARSLPGPNLFTRRAWSLVDRLTIAATWRFR